MGLSFKRLREENYRRCRRWHPNFPNDGMWTSADWSNAVCGEAGEMANVVKKMRRVESGAPVGPDDPNYTELKRMLSDEIADVVIYADLLAAYYGIDLGMAISRKFNEVSERQGFPERLEIEYDV